MQFLAFILDYQAFTVVRPQLTQLIAFISKQKEVDDVYNWYNLNKNLVGLKMAIFQNQVKKRVIIHYSSFDPLCFYPKKRRWLAWT